MASPKQTIHEGKKRFVLVGYTNIGDIREHAKKLKSEGYHVRIKPRAKKGGYKQGALYRR